MGFCTVAAMGEPLDNTERATFSRLTGREQEPLERIDELAVVVGRRGGKTKAVSTLISTRSVPSALAIGCASFADIHSRAIHDGLQTNGIRVGNPGTHNRAASPEVPRHKLQRLLC